MGMKVLVADTIAAEGLARLQAAPGVEVVANGKITPEQLVEQIGEYNALVVRSRTQVTAEVLEAGKKLQIVGRAGVGVDNIDVSAATRRGVLVVNAPEGNTVSTAEHTIAMMAALARHIPQANASLKNGEWARNKFMGVQLAGKTLGVLGLGRVGSEVARRALGMDMQVVAYDPFVTAERARKLGVELGTVDEICKQADFITVHTPLTAETKGLIGPAQFALMKTGVRVINCARGGIIDEAALLAALQDGKVAGAALDVFVDEPPTDSPLLALPQVIATPHLGASTAEAQVGVAVDVVDTILKALDGKPVRTAVNAPYLRGLMQDEKGYLGLAEKVGRLFTALYGGGFERLEFTFAGEAAEIDAQALTAMMLRGILAPLEPDVNYVNAGIIAEERGIQVQEVREPNAGGYTNLITVRGIGPKGERSVSGNLSPEQRRRIVAIDGYRVNVEGEGTMVVAHNLDQPGIIGQVGTVLGEYGINIAFMQVGRKAVGSLAVMVLGIDHDLSDGARTKLLQIDALKDVCVVNW